MLSRIVEFLLRRFLKPETYLRRKGVKIGQGCSIASIHFGSEPYLVEIGNHVQITQEVRFYTHGSSWVFREKDKNIDIFGKIKVGDNVYFGNCALIMPGVIIGNNVIIGAGAVVTKSVPDNSIVAGNPAKVIGTVDDLYERIKDFNMGTKGMIYNEKKEFLLNQADSKFLKK